MGAYYFLTNRKKSPDISLTPGPTAQPVSYLFKLEDGQPTNIHIESKAGDVVELAFNAGNAWVLMKPIKASADQGSVAAAASQIDAIPITDEEFFKGFDVAKLIDENAIRLDPRFKKAETFQGARQIRFGLKYMF